MLLRRLTSTILLKATNTRLHKQIPIRLPHEILAELVQKGASVLDYNNYDPDDVVARSFKDHHVVQQFGMGNCVPIGLYSDATPVFKRHIMVSGSMNITWARHRYITYAVLKDVLCKCGCNGRCTMDVIQLAINASLRCCAQNLHMSSRLDGLPWGQGDPHRSCMAGKPLGVFGAVAEYRADWPEMAAIAGVQEMER